jgi:hypothetical protein
MTASHEAKARLFRVLRPEGRADGLDSFHATNSAYATRDADGYVE